MSNVLKTLILKRFQTIDQEDIIQFANAHNLTETAKHAEHILQVVKQLDPFKQDSLVYFFSYLKSILPTSEVQYIHHLTLKLIEQYNLVDILD